ncbi:MAG: cytochrome d ubiquinol oxidase subunit II [Pseudohongiellaceae bacterium]
MVWACLLGFAVFAYVVLDGFDLGIGILFPFLENETNRDLAMNSIAPVWDGNETWLVLGGGGLMAAFPLAFAILMPAFYAPLTVMLLSLVFRGVAFEFRWRDSRHKKWWDRGFIVGSTVATFAQGIILGTFIQGIEVTGRRYGGGWFDWLTPFSVFTGVALISGYALLGAAWLILKTEGRLQQRLYRLILPCAIATLSAIAIVSLWTPWLSDEIADRWFSWPNIAVLWPIPMFVALLGLVLLAGIRRQREYRLFPIALSLFLLSYAGLGISMYPYMVPRHFTIHQAAAPDTSLGFLLVGTSLLLPMILGYTAYAYWVFRGKVTDQEGYH